MSQIEELYSEILYEILNIVGCDASTEEEQARLLTHLQQTFKLDDEKHNQLLEMAREKEVSEFQGSVPVPDFFLLLLLLLEIICLRFCDKCLLK